ncbi:MAG: DUF2070 family protein [Candidatus Thorarchaeota archaeon]|nr:MAG: DUF2070 family protein [Candidatus Thorarchaeota archaeon]
MGEKAKVKETVRLYSKVWQLPTMKGIVIRIVLSVILFGVALAALRWARFGDLSLFAFYLITLAVPSILGTGLLYAAVRVRESPLDLRRTAGVVQYAILIWFVLGLIGGIIDFLFDTIYFEPRLMLLGLGLSYMLASFLVTGLSDRHIIRNFLSASLPALTWLMTVTLLAYIGWFILGLSVFWPIPVIGLIILSSYAVRRVFLAVSVPFERDLGINGPALLRAFGHDYLCDNSEPFEKLLTQIAVEQDIPVDVVVFKSERNISGAVAILHIHPGPFRDLGSSELPSIVIDHIESTHGIPAMVLHGTCTHHQNLTTKDDIPAILDEIDRLLRETEVTEKSAGPLWSSSSKFKVWTIFARNDVLAITTSAPEFTDDIALEVAQEAIKAVKERTGVVGTVAIADAHNCIDDTAVSVMPGDPDAAKYVESVANAVSDGFAMQASRFSIGFHRQSIDSISKQEGIGPGGICVLVVRRGKVDSALVSIDGNNMEPGMREEIIGMLESMGFVSSEVTTTDTHIVNAISLSSRGYPPVGRHHKEIVVEAIRSTVETARQKAVPSQIGIGKGLVQNLRTFGAKGFDTLTADIVEAWEIAKKEGKLTGSAVILLSIILSFLF